MASWCEPEKGREHQVARIGVTRMHGQLVAVLRATAHLVDVREVQARLNALRVEVQRQRHQVHVAGALAAAEEAALDAVARRPSRANSAAATAGAAVVVRVHAQRRGCRGAPEPVHIHSIWSGVQVGGGRLDRGRQVERSACSVGVGPRRRIRALATSSATSGSVSAEDLGRVFVVPTRFPGGAPRRLLHQP